MKTKMKTTQRIKRCIIFFMLFAFILLPGMQAADVSNGGMASVGNLDDGATATMTLAIYPYVPRPKQFEIVIREAWNKAEPGVTLKFVDWDCYSTDPPRDLDVFVFDAIFLSYFQKKGFLAAIKLDEARDPGDFLAYALEGTELAGTLYGIPQLGCASILFYRQGDQQLTDAETLSAVVKAIGECTYTTEIPPSGTGLMVDISGGTTAACYYLDAVEDIYGKYTDTPPLPPDNTLINPWGIHNVRKLLRMASVKQAKYYNDENPYQRGTWFARGRGRAMIGYTETMSAMDEKALKTVSFKPMPFSDGTGVSLFYSDIIGINSAVTDPEKRRLALKLANLMASTQVVVDCFRPTPENNYPQYLMPVRHSVFYILGKEFPIYNKMYQMVIKCDPHLFRIGPDSKTWLKALKGDIKDQVFNGISGSGKRQRY